MYDMRLQTLNNPLTARAETSAIQIESSSRSGGIEPSLSALQVMHRLLTRLCWQMAPLSTLCNCAFADCAGRCSTLRTPSTCEIRCFLEETKGSSCRKSRPNQDALLPTNYPPISQYVSLRCQVPLVVGAVCRPPARAA